MAKEFDPYKCLAILETMKMCVRKLEEELMIEVDGELVQHEHLKEQEDEERKGESA